LNGAATAFVNDGGSNHYLKVRLPDDAYSMGAKVTVTTSQGRNLTDWHVAGEGLVADQTHILTFGLGDETAVRSVEVKYPDGRSQALENPPIDRVTTFADSRGHAESASPHNPSATAE